MDLGEGRRVTGLMRSFGQVVIEVVSKETGWKLVVFDFLGDLANTFSRGCIFFKRVEVFEKCSVVF